MNVFLDLTWPASIKLNSNACITVNYYNYLVYMALHRHLKRRKSDFIMIMVSVATTKHMIKASTISLTAELANLEAMKQCVCINTVL